MPLATLAPTANPQAPNCIAASASIKHPIACLRMRRNTSVRVLELLERETGVSSASTTGAQELISLIGSARLCEEMARMERCGTSFRAMIAEPDFAKHLGRLEAEPVSQDVCWSPAELEASTRRALAWPSPSRGGRVRN